MHQNNGNSAKKKKKNSDEQLNKAQRRTKGNVPNPELVILSCCSNTVLLHLWALLNLENTTIKFNPFQGCLTPVGSLQWAELAAVSATQTDPLTFPRVLHGHHDTITTPSVAANVLYNNTTGRVLHLRRAVQPPPPPPLPSHSSLIKSLE